MLLQLSSSPVFMAVYVLIVVGADLTEQAQAETQAQVIIYSLSEKKEDERKCLFLL